MAWKLRGKKSHSIILLFIIHHETHTRDNQMSKYIFQSSSIFDILIIEKLLFE